jgi:hypothetical protein
MIRIENYSNVSGLKTLNDLELRFPALPFGATYLSNWIKYYSRRRASQVFPGLVNRDNSALKIRNAITAANIAYMQWRYIDEISYSTSP